MKGLLFLLESTHIHLYTQTYTHTEHMHTPSRVPYLLRDLVNVEELEML